MECAVSAISAVGLGKLSIHRVAITNSAPTSFRLPICQRKNSGRELSGKHS